MKDLKRILWYLKQKEVAKFKWVNLDIYIEEDLDEAILIKQLLDNIIEIKHMKSDFEN